MARKPLGAGLGVVGHASGDTRESKRETDNAFLKVLVEQGVVGALAFALGLLALCAGLARSVACHETRPRSGQPRCSDSRGSPCSR